jgi:MarR family transcriptional regulator, organic hydroperoxide resistance regulator
MLANAGWRRATFRPGHVGSAKAATACAYAPDFRYDRAMPENPAPPVEDEQPQRVLRQFRIVFNAVKSHFRQVEREAGLGGAQLWALSVIDRHPGIGATGLARELDIHQSTASNLVRGLVERGFVTASREGADRRNVALHLQDAGREVLQRAPLPFAGVLPDALASLDEATLEQLEQNLARLIGRLDVDEAAGRTPLAQL